MKCILSPVIFVLLAIFFNFDKESIAVLFVMYSVPTAIASYVMTDIMKCDSKLAANMIVFSTLTSIFSFTVGIFLLKIFKIL
ncbi:MAG: AEC family transporter [Fusobacteriaceae bacterium]